jgi:glycosyltransferase involved in cell wall biosynthesis
LAAAGRTVKILHVTDSYLPTLGGIELHVRDLCERQRRAGHDVTVSTRTPAAPGEHSDGVRRVGGGERSWMDEHGPDVVHAHVSVISPFALAAARCAARRGIPTVITVHSLWTRVGRLPELARDLWRMDHWKVTWTAVSERAAQPVRDVLGVAVQVVPNAVDLIEWQPFDELPATRPPHVLSVMRLTGVKRALPLVRTLRRVSEQADLTATIVGDGPERGAMERYLRRHCLEDRVELTGTLDRSAIRRRLAEASVFVAPAHRESFGIAALEARASGVPVIASSRSGVATFIEHGVDGLLGRDDRELGRHLLTIVRDDDLRNRVAGHNRCTPPSFGWDQAIERNAAVYADAVATCARSRRPRRSAAPRVLVG